MFRNVCVLLTQNKNILMLTTAGMYILALYGVLNEQIFAYSLILSLLFLFIIFKNLIPYRYIVVWSLIFYFGIINTSMRLKQTDELLNLAPINSRIEGTIISIPQGISDNKPKFFFKTNKIKFGNIEKTFKNEKVLVTINSTDEPQNNLNDLKLYNSYVLNGRLSTPFKAGNPSQFDYGNYLRNHNAYAVFYAKDFKILPTKVTFKQKFLQNINDYRESIIKTHSKYMESPNLEILGGIVFGDDAVSPPKNIKQSFVNSGLLHILAASGMNVAFIYGFFFSLMSILRIPFKIRVTTGMIMVLIYSLMTGLGASVIRATFMLMFVLIGKLIDRDAHSISLLSFVALLMLIYNPLWINDVGFQLSFIVTFGILVMAPAFARFNNKIIDSAISTLTIPIIAQLWVIPIQIFYFNNISLYSVFANIMSVPILMVLSFGGFISSLLSVVKPIAEYICMGFDLILNPLITLLVNISDFWGKLPNSSIQTSHPSVFQIFLYYGILLALSVMLYKELRQKYFKKALILFGILLSILFLTVIPINNKYPEITAFDVGNADCFMIKTPDNKYILIDTGKSGYNGGKSQAEIIVIKYLKDKGIKNIDSIIVTHFDNDHCGGAVDLMKSLKVDKIYLNEINHNSNAAIQIYKTAKQMGVKQIPVGNKQIVYKNGDLNIINLNNYQGKSDNDNSIITLLTYKDFSMLFTGDAGINGINAILNEVPRNITVLKVPHHGAIGGIDAKIIKYLNPKYSIISTGENKFGHPSFYILSLLKNSMIIRTDTNNSIQIKFNSQGYIVKNYDIKKRKYQKFL
ncbi:MAG: DNA internalization-related competence protein ComEC/Rec2 [bacterium]|nr:DNA internalization-related competence protein ComEC/Rec2 [bacterium]